MKIGRNDPCFCGSGKKYKKCHLLVQEEVTRIENLEWEEWFAKDIAQGQANLKEAEKSLPKSE